MLFALSVLAGCTAPALDAEPAAGGTTEAGLEPFRVLGMPLREPAIVQHPDGALFLAGFDEDQSAEGVHRPRLYRSDDGGATWSRVEQGGLGEGPLGNSDTDLAVAPDGTLYHATLQFLPVGYGISVGASEDAGATWGWNTVAIAPFLDRPWVEVGPDGTAHLTWSSALGLHHASSDDRGRTWTEGPRIHATSGSGGLAVGPGGELAVRLFPIRAPAFFIFAAAFLLIDEGADGVAVSVDGGATWEVRELPGTRAYPDQRTEGGDVPRWSDPIAFDAAGTLYTLWSEVNVLQMGVSRDLGASWEVVPIARSDDDPLFFPYLRAAAPGELVATWFSGEAAFTGDGERSVHVARVASADSATPIVDARGFPLAGPPNGEYFQATFLRDGGIAAAWPHQGEDGDEGFAFLSWPAHATLEKARA